MSEAKERQQRAVTRFLIRNNLAEAASVVIELQNQNDALRAQNKRLSGIILRYKEHIEAGTNQIFIDNLIAKYTAEKSLVDIKIQAIKEAFYDFTLELELKERIEFNLMVEEYINALLKRNGRSE